MPVTKARFKFVKGRGSLKNVNVFNSETPVAGGELITATAAPQVLLCVPASAGFILGVLPIKPR